MEVHCTLQRADYSREEFGPILVHQVLDLLRSDIWAAEIQKYCALEEKRQDNCPPNLHLGATNGRSMLICTTEEGLWWITYRYTVETKKFWFLRDTRDEEHLAGRRTAVEAERLVVAFFSEAHEKLTFCDRSI